jgi:hypothetical protein
VKLAGLQVLWVWCLVLPMMAGDWWDSAFNFLNGGVSLVLILAVLHAYRTGWAKSFACVSLLQVLMNTADAVWGIAVDTYNATQTILNTLEFILLFFVGTAAELESGNERARSADRSGSRGFGRQ